MEDRTLLSTFDVTNTADSGSGSLRQAILDSNAATGQANTIDFAIPGNGVQTISPLSALPPITQAVLVDGWSQPGYAGTPLIQIDGSQAGNSDGLTITGSNATVRGLDIGGFAQGAGIHTTGASATGNWIYGNFLGTDPSGTQAVSNEEGVEIDGGAANTTIGGTAAGAGNVISANGAAGIWITGAGTTGVVVQQNFIGTDLTGTKALGNAYQGVEIGGGAANNTIGGTTAGAGNVISANDECGIWITGAGTTGVVVQQNFIGTDLTGTKALGNAYQGVEIGGGAANNTIGGTTAGAGNVISANDECGIWITGAGTTGVVVQHNLIGTDLTGTMPLGNAYPGVKIGGGAANTTIGGTTAGAGNVISANQSDGIWITGAGTTGVVVEQNFIGTDLTGTKDLGNVNEGVEIDGGAANITIGGTTARAGNVISANGDDGIWISDAGTTGVVVEQNFIGTDVTGTKDLGNVNEGVEIDGGAANITIGGTTARAGNVISANGDDGIWITGAGTTGVVLDQNLIGTDVTGVPKKALGNANFGVQTDVAAVSQAGGLTSSDGVFHTFDFPSGKLVAALTLGGNLSGPPQGQSGGGPTAVYPIDVETDGLLIAIVHAQGFSSRLMLLDSQGRVVVQSDGLSPSDPDSVIDQDLTPGNYSLVVESTGGTGAYTLTTTLTPASAPFQPIPVGSDPLSIVAGDFNGDGRTDLAVANDVDNTVSILLGNGDGTFQPQVTYAVGQDPTSIVAGDFTGDGRTDLAVANGVDNTVSILLGNGDGTFQPQVTYAVGQDPTSIVASDFTGDGRTDLAVANYDDNDVSVLLGNGDGTFQDQKTYPVGHEPEAIVAGDFNGDKRTDLAIANYLDNDVSVLLNKGDGTFQDQKTYAVGHEPEAIVAGDFTGDGRTDLAVANAYDDDVSVLLNKGDGTFQDQKTYAVGVWPDAIVAGDFNGDGRTDLAVANVADNDVSILLGNGDGTFQDQVTYPVGAARRDRGGRLQWRRPHRPGYRQQLRRRRRVDPPGQRRRHLPGPGAERGWGQSRRDRGGRLHRRRPHRPRHRQRGLKRRVDPPGQQRRHLPGPEDVPGGERALRDRGGRLQRRRPHRPGNRQL